jgi:hypothetical protein
MVRRTSAIPDEITERPSEALSNPDASNAIDAWLGVFVRLLHLRDSQRQAIRDELAEHLRERTRDMMLGGCTETDAVRLAIDELGETAALAKRFETANRPQRRLLMHLSLLGLSAGVITLGVVALSPNQPRVPAAMFESMAQTTAPPEQLRDVKVNVDFKDASLDDVVNYYADLAKRSAVVRWPELEEAGLNHDSVINLQARNIRLAKAFELVAAELSRSGAAIEWRFDDDMIELGTREKFDQRDIALVSYDISHILQSIGEQYGLDYNAIIERVAELVQTMVEPDNWRENGGSLAHLQIVGGKLFVEAPRRMHSRIEWILQQLGDGVQPVGKDGVKQGQAVPVPGYLPTIGLLFQRDHPAPPAVEFQTAPR